MSTYSIILLLAEILNVSVGVFVYFKNKKSRINSSFFLLTLVLSLWFLGCFGESVVEGKEIALIWDKILYTGVCLYPLTFLNFLFDIIQKKKNKILFKSLFIISILFIIINYSPFLRPLLIRDVERKFLFRFIAVPGFLWFILVILGMAICVYGIYLIFSIWKVSRGYKKAQMAYLFIAYTILTIGGGMYFLLPLDIRVPPIDALAAVIFSFITAYAIIKHHLMDIRVAVTRTGIFLFVYTLVLSVPYKIVPPDGWNNWWNNWVCQGRFSGHTVANMLI